MSLIRTLNTAVTGLLQHQLKMDVISNNIANVNTTAFKAQRATFQDLLSHTLKSALGPRGALGGTNANQVGMGVMLGSIDTLMTQGTLEATGRATDIAIQGDGFFMMEKNNVQVFTRDGNFSLDSSKNLVDSAGGYYVQGWNVGNNSTNPDPFAIDTSLPTTQIDLPIGVKKMAKATTTVEYASNINADSLVRQPNFSQMRVRPGNSSDWQTINIKWTEITDATDSHRWEWFAEVTNGGGRVVGANTGAVIFNDAGRVTTNTQTTLTIADAAGNQVRLFIAPDKRLVGANNPARPLSHLNVAEWTAAAANATRRTYDFRDNGAANPAAGAAAVAGDADRNILVAIDPSQIVTDVLTVDGDLTNEDPYTTIAMADGAPLEAFFMDTNNGWNEGGFENELVIIPEWRLATTTLAGVTTYKYLRTTFYKGSDSGTTDSTGTVRAQLTQENTDKDPNGTTVNDLEHRTDNNYWVYKIELFRNESDLGAGNNVQAAFADDVAAPAITGQLRQTLNGVTGAVLANATVSKTLVMSDTGYISGGDGTQDQVTFVLDSDEDGVYTDLEDRVITPPATNTGPDPLTFTLNAGADPNLQGVFDTGDIYRNSVQAYDSLGSAHNLTLRYSKAGMNAWDLVAALPENDNAEDSLRGNYLNLQFNTSGQRPTFTIDNVVLQNLAPSTISFSPAGANTAGITPDFDLATQFAGENTVRAISQDGYAMGVLQTFVIENTGGITGVYANGLRTTEAQLAMAMFRNPEGLTKAGDNLYLQSPNAGILQQGTPGNNGFGETFGGMLEASNVDLAVEFTNMIITQRGFQANTRSVTTADEMVQDVIAMKR